jgi:hypothetical protein
MLPEHRRLVQNTGCQIPEDITLQIQHRETLRSSDATKFIIDIMRLELIVYITTPSQLRSLCNDN